MFSLLEYIKIHRISLIQDMESIPYLTYPELKRDFENQIHVLDHLIKVAEETG
jgi:hypothetical protein